LAISKNCPDHGINNTKSEFEVYDVGHLYNINFLISEHQVSIWLQFVTGILGGIGAT
jgi:uncharacterized protein (DUF849 family)